MPISFGFGAGDILTLMGLAIHCYNDCRQAGGQFRRMGHEVSTFRNALETIHDELSNGDSALAQQPGHKKQLLIDSINDCEDLIHEVFALLDSFRGLNPARESSAGRKALDRARYTLTGASGRFNGIRQRMTRHVTDIMFQLDILEIGRTREIENVLDVTRREMREGLAGIETTIFAVARRLRRGQAESVSSSGLSSVEDDGWRAIKEELRRLGFRSREISRSKRALLAYVAKRPLREPTPSGEPERRARSSSSGGSTSSGLSQVSRIRGRRRVRGRRKVSRNRYPTRISPHAHANAAQDPAHERSGTPPPLYRSRSRQNPCGPYIQYGQRASPRRRRVSTNTDLLLLVATGIAIASVSYIALDKLDQYEKKRRR